MGETRQQRRAAERAAAKSARKERNGHAEKLRAGPLSPAPVPKGEVIEGEELARLDARNFSYVRAALEHLLAPRVGASLIAEFDAIQSESERLAEGGEDLPADKERRAMELEQCFREAASEREIYDFLWASVLEPGDALPAEVGMPALETCDPDVLCRARERIKALAT